MDVLQTGFERGPSVFPSGAMLGTAGVSYSEKNQVGGSVMFGSGAFLCANVRGKLREGRYDVMSKSCHGGVKSLSGEREARNLGAQGMRTVSW